MILLRIAQNEHATFGVLKEQGFPFALTLELPWRDNTAEYSCIPSGFYVCKRIQSPKFGNTFEIVNVAGRSNILFHKGNKDEDTKGCILVGEEFSVIDGERAISSSARGFAEFMELNKDKNEFDLFVLTQTGG
ncbi:MAG: DUF5675 family protein [Rectinemataceae bacterium]|nr:DUF5675 family protein [Rectinemataceae bacterium]